MKAHARRVVHSSGRGDWETPPDLFAALHEEFRFDVDAAASEENRLLDIWYGPGSGREDALDGTPWRGRLFCNPPYGRRINKWLEIGVVSTLLERTDDIAEVVVFLLPARTDTAWFHTWVVPYATDVRFLRGRLRFRLGGKALDPAPFPSMIAVFHPPQRRWARMA